MASEQDVFITRVIDRGLEVFEESRKRGSEELETPAAKNALALRRRRSRERLWKLPLDIVELILQRLDFDSLMAVAQQQHLRFYWSLAVLVNTARYGRPAGDEPYMFGPLARRVLERFSVARQSDKGGVYLSAGYQNVLRRRKLPAKGMLTLPRRDEILRAIRHIVFCGVFGDYAPNKAWTSLACFMLEFDARILIGRATAEGISKALRVGPRVSVWPLCSTFAFVLESHVQEMREWLRVALRTNYYHNQTPTEAAHAMSESLPPVVRSLSKLLSENASADFKFDRATAIDPPLGPRDDVDKRRNPGAMALFPISIVVWTGADPRKRPAASRSGLGPISLPPGVLNDDALMIGEEYNINLLLRGGYTTSAARFLRRNPDPTLWKFSIEFAFFDSTVAETPGKYQGGMGARIHSAPSVYFLHGAQPPKELKGAVQLETFGVTTSIDLLAPLASYAQAEDCDNQVAVALKNVEDYPDSISVNAALAVARRHATEAKIDAGLSPDSTDFWAVFNKWQQVV